MSRRALINRSGSKLDRPVGLSAALKWASRDASRASTQRFTSRSGWSGADAVLGRKDVEQGRVRVDPATHDCSPRVRRV